MEYPIPGFLRKQEEKYRRGYDLSEMDKSFAKKMVWESIEKKCNILF